jgi:hypothetical protein
MLTSLARMVDLHAHPGRPALGLGRCEATQGGPPRCRKIAVVHLQKLADAPSAWWRTMSKSGADCRGAYRVERSALVLLDESRASSRKAIDAAEVARCRLDPSGKRGPEDCSTLQPISCHLDALELLPLLRGFSWEPPYHRGAPAFRISGSGPLHAPSAGTMRIPLMAFTDAPPGILIPEHEEAALLPRPRRADRAASRASPPRQRRGRTPRDLLRDAPRRALRRCDGPAMAS